MPEFAPEFAAFATKYSTEAIETRKKLPHAIQVALLDIIDGFTNNPEALPDRCRPISRDGKIRVYIHPDPHIEVTYEIDQESKIIYFLHFAAPQMQNPKSLFISYSHDDKEWLDKLKKWLKPLEQAGVVSLWDDSKILAGSQWREEIKRNIEDAKVALLLISQNFLASEFITKNELPPLLDAAKEKGVLVLWLALSSSTVSDTSIPKYLGLNDPKQPLDTLSQGDQNKYLLLAYEKIKKSLEAVH